MNHRRRRAVRFEQLLWLSTQPETGLVSYLINTSLRESGTPACISSRITTVIQVVRYHQINHNWFNEPFAVSQYSRLYLDMHGLIFETSIWLLAGSTRYLAETNKSRRSKATSDPSKQSKCRVSQGFHEVVHNASARERRRIRSTRATRQQTTFLSV